MIVYLSIGNSDDKLSQKDWAQFGRDIAGYVVRWASRVHGTWASLPDSPYQNACWCLEFDDQVSLDAARQQAMMVRKHYHQDSVAWAEVPETEFI